MQWLLEVITLRSLNDIVTLVTPGKTTIVDGFPVKSEPMETEIFCSVQSVTRTEFYQAQSAGIKADIEFIVLYDDYQDQKEFKYDNKPYKLVRSYRKSEYQISLICSEVI